MVKEYEYIIIQALQRFDKQFSRSSDPATFGIEVIQKRRDGNFAFEVYTLRPDDQFRLRMYYTITNVDSVGEFRLENRVPNTDIPETMEVFSALATIDGFHFEKGTFKLEPFLAAPAQVDFLLQNNNQPFLLENDAFLELESE